MILGGDVKEPERMNQDDGGLMSLSRHWKLFLLAFLALVFTGLQVAWAVTVIYPSVPHAKLSCYFFSLQGHLVDQSKLHKGFKGYLVCNLLKNRTLYVYEEPIELRNDTLEISLPSQDEYTCVNVELNITRLNFLVEELQSKDIVLPLSSLVSSICRYRYSYDITLYLLEISRGEDLIKLRELFTSGKLQKLAIPRLGSTLYTIMVSNIQGNSSIEIPMISIPEVFSNAPTIPESVKISFNDSLPLPLQLFVGASPDRLRLVKLHPSRACELEIRGYKVLVNREASLVVPSNSVKVNGFIVPLQRSSCDIYAYPSSMISDCSYASDYGVSISEPSYGNYFLAFNVTVDPRFTVLKNVSVIIYRNGRVYASYHYALILLRPVRITVLVPFDGSGTNVFKVVVIPRNLDPKQVEARFFVPNPVPAVEASIEVRKSYGKILLIIWFMLTLSVLIILAASEPRFKL